MASSSAPRRPAGGAAKEGDGQIFGTNKRGELAEFRDGLNNPNKDIQRDTVKKVIAAMTVGKDVSALFGDIVKNVQTNNIETKKLIYLYIMNYAKTKPELAMMAVNTFNQDAQDPNPLVRALAVRTMGCVRVENVQEYLAEPLRRAIKDPDPYVRKTAAIGVAKLYDIAPEIVRDQGFLDLLTDLISDSNPAVVANAVTALSEIGGLDLSRKTVQKMLVAMNECSEWGQVAILDALAGYRPLDNRDALDICERVAPRLNHANPAVVLGAVKTVLAMLDAVGDDADDDQAKVYIKKMGPPLVTMLNGDPEVQYVALRNIDLILQKRPQAIHSDVKVFFAKYNDPIYVKMEKLEIMIRLATERNIDAILLEFKEYATEVDVEFVRKAVRAIGRCAINLERAADKCVLVLVDLIKTKVNYVVQEAIVVIKDIFRKYPDRYETVIATLCENLDTLDEPEAKASMIWVIGEYASRIDNGDELLMYFLDGFTDEPANVQLALLTAVVKLYLNDPERHGELVQSTLQKATDETDNPDLRDRAYIYWRLLSSDPDAAREIVMGKKPLIDEASARLDPTLLNRLAKELGLLSSVYQKPAEAFVPDFKGKALGTDEEEEQEEEESPSSASPSAGGASGDLFDFGGSSSSSSAAAPKAEKIEKQLWLDAARGKGLEIYGVCIGNEMRMTLRNTSDAPMSGFAMQFNKNSYGLAPAAPLRVAEPLQPGSAQDAKVAFAVGQNVGPYNPNLQVAVKFSSGVVYLQAPFEPSVLFSTDGPMERPEFLATWQSIDDSQEKSFKVPLGSVKSAEQVKAILQAKGIYTVTEKKIEGGATALYAAARVKASGDAVLVEAKVPALGGAAPKNDMDDLFGFTAGPASSGAELSVAVRTSCPVVEGLQPMLTKAFA